MKKGPSFYSIIPAHIRYSEELSPNAKLLYGEITALCNKEGFCWATNTYFAKLYQVNKITISRWILSLEQNSFIKCEIKNNNMRRIFIEGGYAKRARGIGKKSTGDRQKCHALYNNTINNTNISVTKRVGHGLIKSNTKKSFDTICANKLEEAIRINRKIFRKVNKKQWVLHFQKFRLKSEIKKSRIKKVLTWYARRFGEEFVPKAYSAKSFCDKFLNIEDAMERSIEDVKKGKVKITSRIRNKRTVVMD